MDKVENMERGQIGKLPFHFQGSVSMQMQTLAAVRTTPRPNAHSSKYSDGEVDNKTYLEKIKELRKYTGLLQRTIAKKGERKPSKMTKLLEILTKPHQRLPWKILLKCEVALKNLEMTNVNVTVDIPIPTPATPQQSTQEIETLHNLCESVSAAIKNSTRVEICRSRFQPAVDSLLGTSAWKSPTKDESDDEEETSHIPWILEKEFRMIDSSRFKITVVAEQMDKSFGIILDCELVDSKLPSVPNLQLLVSPNYPDVRPTIKDLNVVYGATPFFSAVANALTSRLYYLSEIYTVSELLNAWEMSVRQIANPKSSVQHAKSSSISGVSSRLEI